MKFVLHERLAADSVEVSDLRLCRVLLMNDARFPWLILVPRKEAVSELFELSSPELKLLIDEVASCAGRLLEITGLKRINVGILGNIVPQMHVHVVARSSDDPAWPGPVWGSGEPRAYSPESRANLVRRLKKALSKR